MTRKVLLSVHMATVLQMVTVASLGLSTLKVAWADPPKGQTYVGAKRCASCHFKQFVAWKKDSHAKAFELLPLEYQSDARCLKCHSTGHGEPTGFKNIKATPSLSGVTCESCHGPGSKHSNIADGFSKKKLSEEEEKLVRDSIWLLLPENHCAKCHKAHQAKTQGMGEAPSGGCLFSAPFSE